MNDIQAIKIARKIDKLNNQITTLVLELAEHPNGEAMIESLRDNTFDNPALATHCIVNDLENPERWECINDQRKGLQRRRTQLAPDLGQV